MKSSKLGDLVDITIGRTPSRSNSEYWDKSKRTDNVWLSISDLLNVNGKIVKDSNEYITDIAANDFKSIPRGTLLVSFKLTLGRLAFAGRELRTNEAIAALRNNESIVLNEYLYYYLSYFDWMSFAAKDKKVKGYTLNKAKLRDITIVYPEAFEDQRLLIEKLSTAFEKIDQAIILTKQNTENIRALYRSKFRLLMNDTTGVEVALADVCEISTKLVDPKKEPYSEQLHVGAANIKPETGELTNLKTARQEKLISGKFPFDENTILYSKIRPYLKKAARPNFSGICSADIYPLNCKEELDKDYLFYLLLSPDFTQYAISGSERAGMPKVNREHLFAYTFNLPDKVLQHEVVQKLDSLLKFEISAIEKYNKKLDQLSSLKQSLLKESFAGSAVK